jgi:tryptophan synthase alpha chain
MSNRIDATLDALAKSGRNALGPFLTVGYPDLETSTLLARVVLESGADMLELGVPFSDPLAEGPTIQRTSFQALQQGVNVHTCLGVIRRLRREGVDSPLIFMGYVNPFLNYGMERFARDAAEAGLDGVIVPDLPSEEAGLFAGLLEAQGIYVIPLLAPTSSDKRIEQACRRAKGFIYCVSLTGVTGARTELGIGVQDLVERVRRFTDLPLLVGFGVSRIEHVEAIAKFADGAMVGSALLDAVGNVPKGRVLETAREFIEGLTMPDGVEKK